jgi:peptide/nickel transport system ATP-binding protein
MALLEAKSLKYSATVRKGVKSTRMEILRDITLQLGEGTILGLVGENGAGKSTLARCLAGLTTPSSGELWFQGVNLYPEIANRAKIGTDIQMVFQNHSATLDPLLTIRSSILEGAGGLRGPQAEAELKRLLDLVELPAELRDSYPHQLSGGQRQRVALARALSVAPRLLILDEPTSSLDALTQAQILGTLGGIRQNLRVAILFISHDLASTLTFCDEVAVLHGGIIVETGTPANIRSNPGHPYTRAIVGELGDRSLQK